MSTEPFVPLIAPAASADSSANFRLLIAPHPERAQPVQAAASPAAPATTPVCEPRIVLSRDQNRVTAIHVHCSCGQVIELLCAYP